jgi:ribonuclease P protein component
MLPGSDYVIIGREDVLAAPFSEIRTELSRRLRKPR